MLSIKNEYSTLKRVIVCFGKSIPDYKSYSSDDPEFTKYHKNSWDKDLLLRQQEGFFKKLEAYNVKLELLKVDQSLPWQMYTRDTGFVIGDKFFFSKNRGFKEREGEIDIVLDLLSEDDKKGLEEIKDGNIDGGDVLVSDEFSLVGNGSRTSESAIANLSSKVKIKKLFLGENVMHLDTRLTILPGKFALIVPEAIKKEDLKYLESEYELIRVTEQEAKFLGTNVFVVNPETIFVPKQHKRIADLLKAEKFNIELIDYTEPINLGGSFRCTTLPLLREEILI